MWLTGRMDSPNQSGKRCAGWSEISQEWSKIDILSYRGAQKHIFSKRCNPMKFLHQNLWKSIQPSESLLFFWQARERRLVYTAWLFPTKREWYSSQNVGQTINVPNSTDGWSRRPLRLGAVWKHNTVQILRTEHKSRRDSDTVGTPGQTDRQTSKTASCPKWLFSFFCQDPDREAEIISSPLLSLWTLCQNNQTTDGQMEVFLKGS